MDRRAEPRVAVRTPARLFYGPRLEMWADGVVRDRSHSGAKVEIGEVFKLPSRLIIIDLPTGIAFDAIVKWRRGDLAGLQFEARHELRGEVEPRLAHIRTTWAALCGGASAA